LQIFFGHGIVVEVHFALEELSCFGVREVNGTLHFTFATVANPVRSMLLVVEIEFAVFTGLRKQQHWLNGDFSLQGNFLAIEMGASG
jgi:hypothetical protein